MTKIGVVAYQMTRLVETNILVWKDFHFSYFNLVKFIVKNAQTCSPETSPGEAYESITTPFAAQIRRVFTHFGTSESIVVNLQS